MKNFAILTAAAIIMMIVSLNRWENGTAVIDYYGSINPGGQETLPGFPGAGLCNLSCTFTDDNGRCLVFCLNYETLQRRMTLLISRWIFICMTPSLTRE